jgi:hypothetical protein
MMHNLISFNQLAFFNDNVEKIQEDFDNDMNDYFQCLVEYANNPRSIHIIRSIPFHNVSIIENK